MLEEDKGRFPRLTITGEGNNEAGKEDGRRRRLGQGTLRGFNYVIIIIAQS